jgi:large subunit ribosomal protein L31
MAQLAAERHNEASLESAGRKVQIMENRHLPREIRSIRAKIPACHGAAACYVVRPFMKADIHPKYVDAEIRCACGNVIKTRSTKQTVIIGICNVCHPFYTGQQKFVDTAGRVDKFQQRAAKTQAAQAAFEAGKKKKK